MNQPITFVVNPAHTAAIIQVPLAGRGEDATSIHALATLRNQVIPATLGRVPGVQVAVVPVSWPRNLLSGSEPDG